MTTKLGVVPQYPPRQRERGEINPSATSSHPQTSSIGSLADVPEEGKLVRVGNMLQIVPER